MEYLFLKQLVLLCIGGQVKEALSVLMLCAPVFAYVVVYRSDCCYLPFSMHFSEFLSNFFHKKTEQNMKILGVRHFCMIPKWPLIVIRHAKH